MIARRRRALCLGVLLCALGGFASTVYALVPRAARVIDAVAHANVSGRRVRALRFQVELHIGDGPPVAVGELVTHPTGLARLELRAPGGLVERHILLGDQHSAARNARLLVRPRAFLPPLFVLQSNSGAVLEAALGTLGVNRRLIGLAPCGDDDCYVIGDPERAVRKPPMPEKAGEADEMKAADAPPADERLARLEDEVHEDGFELQPDPQAAMQQTFASLWVDTTDYNVRAVESREGVRVTLGPYVRFERVSVPKWWSIDEPGKREVRFDVEGVVEVNAPAAAFSKSWLMAPVIEDTPPPPDEGVSSASPEPLPETPPVSTAPREEDLDATGFDDHPDAPDGGYDYPN